MNKIIEKNSVYMILELNRNKKLTIDTEDYDKIKMFHWCACFEPHTNSYYCRSSIKTGEGPKRKTTGVHRIIINPSENKYVDHINHDPLDNRKSNLRVCDNMDNTHNRRAGKNNTTGQKGVDFDKKSGKYRARIRVNYKRISLGKFEILEDAIFAYNQASVKYYGEFHFGN